MTAAAKKNPAPVEAGAGPDFEKLLPAKDSTSELLREAQVVIAAMLKTADRLDANGRRLLALAGGDR